jgi:two-component system sensor histidine kinase RegB
MAPTTLNPEAPGGLNARRLLWIRMIAVPGAALCLLLARQVYGLAVPALQLSLIVGGLVAINFVIWWRHRDARPVSDRQFFIQLLVDLFALTSILYYSGGASNPFVYFFLLPMAISAAALPQTYTWVIALISAGSYTVLMLWRVEVPEFNNFHMTSAMDLHAFGMWVGFVVLSALFATFVSAMAQTVRERDRHLARMRENVLRDERVVAVATLAAGAAHELSMPLATMAVVTGDRPGYPRSPIRPAPISASSGTRLPVQGSALGDFRISGRRPRRFSRVAGTRPLCRAGSR